MTNSLAVSGILHRYRDSHAYRRYIAKPGLCDSVCESCRHAHDSCLPDHDGLYDTADPSCMTTRYRHGSQRRSITTVVRLITKIVKIRAQGEKR